jgi:hypothetical protein
LGKKICIFFHNERHFQPKNALFAPLIWNKTLYSRGTVFPRPSREFPKKIWRPHATVNQKFFPGPFALTRLFPASTNEPFFTFFGVLGDLGGEKFFAESPQPFRLPIGSEKNRAGARMWCFSPPTKHPAFAQQLAIPPKPKSNCREGVVLILRQALPPPIAARAS